MKSRIISAIIAITYLVSAYVTADAATMWKVGLFLIMPLACIWFSDAMGGYTGMTARGAFTSTTPGCLVAFGGWLLLILPIIFAISMAMNASN